MRVVFDQRSGVEHPFGDVLTVGMTAKREALIELVRQVRQREIEHLREDERWMGMPCPYPFVYGAFSWFATSLTAYLQLIPLADRLRLNPAELNSITANRASIKAAGISLLDEACPAVKLWRDKVGAHAAISDPRKDDGLALLLSSLSYPISAQGRRFYVGVGGHSVFSAGSSLPTSTHRWESWSITETFNRLAPRFWPDADIEPH